MAPIKLYSLLVQDGLLFIPMLIEWLTMLKIHAIFV